MPFYWPVILLQRKFGVFQDLWVAFIAQIWKKFLEMSASELKLKKPQTSLIGF